MNTPQRLTAIAFFVPLLATALVATPAHAAVTATQAGADSQTHAGVRAPDTSHYGTSDRSSDVVADPYVLSRADSREESGFSRVIDSAAGAVQFSNPGAADFFVRSSVNLDAGTGEFQYPAHGAASGSVFYDFSVSTASTLALTFSAFSSGVTSTANSYVALNLLNADTHSYLTQGLIGGTQTLSYAVPAGHYGLTLTAFSEGAIPANIPANLAIASGATANLSLSIAAVPVPEPATAALMIFGLCAITAAGRRRGAAR